MSTKPINQNKLRRIQSSIRSVVDKQNEIFGDCCYIFRLKEIDELPEEYKKSMMSFGENSVSFFPLKNRDCYRIIKTSIPLKNTGVETLYSDDASGRQDTIFLPDRGQVKNGDIISVLDESRQKFYFYTIKKIMETSEGTITCDITPLYNQEIRKSELDFFTSMEFNDNFIDFVYTPITFENE